MTTVAIAETSAPRTNALGRLYRGETRFDFVGRKRWWYLLSLTIIVAGLVSLGVRGLNLGIDFKGGSSWTAPLPAKVSAQAVASAVTKAGVHDATVEVLGTGTSRQVQVQADLNSLSKSQQASLKQKVTAALALVTHSQASKVSFSDVGPTWGGQITQKAIIAVLVFFVAVVAYISFRFEFKMAIAALIAVIHDVLVVTGVYSLSGLQVTPDTVVAILTILGYSLYDTVVVFDRVADNTKNFGASGRMTYEEVVNLSMNQTLARSINTSLVAILPTLSVLLIGAYLLGAVTLQYFGFALVIGLCSGAYSSIFIASPILAQMKEREPRYASIRQKIESRGDRTGLLTPKAAAALSAASTSGGSGRRPTSGASSKARGGGPSAGGQVLRPSSTTARGAGSASPGSRSKSVATVETVGGGGPDVTSGGSGDGAETTKPGSARVGAGTGQRRPQAGARRPPQRKKGGSKKGRRR